MNDALAIYLLCIFAGAVYAQLWDSHIHAGSWKRIVWERLGLVLVGAAAGSLAYFGLVMWVFIIRVLI